MSKIKPYDHPDYVGGWVWTKLELDWINERIGTLEAALFQAQEAAKDLEARLTKTEGWLNEAMWNYGELKREQLANREKTSSSPKQDWEAVAADQAMTIALLKSELAAQPAPVQEPVTILPDGSAFGVMSFPLPQNHWLYAPNEYRDGEYEPIDLPKPILTHALRDAVVAAVRYAVRGATMRGQEMDFDPDALVQNAVYALCGPYTTPPAAPAHYPLPDNMYDSKDWRDADYAGRVEWLHTMYESSKKTLEAYTAAPVQEPHSWYSPDLGDYTRTKPEMGEGVTWIALFAASPSPAAQPAIPEGWKLMPAAEHIYNGACPEPASPDDRDPECPACRTMMNAPPAPVQEQTDWEAVAADQAMTIAMMKTELAAQPAPVQEPVPKNFMDALKFDVAARDAREWERVDMLEHAEGNLGIGTAQPAPVQEPVADAQKRAAFEQFWVTEIGDKDDLTYGGLGYAINRVAVAWEAWKTAAQRQWVGLDEADFDGVVTSDAFEAGARWADFKLREKNTGA